MIKNKKIYRLFLALSILICLLLVFHQTAQFQDLYDEFLFFKQWGQHKELGKKSTQSSIPQYKFDVTCYNTNFREISLLDTLQKDTLIEDMLAPGVEGTFDIVLTTNLDTNYQVIFKSQTKKPKNLKFENLENNQIVNTVEELTTKGTLQKHKVKTITIHWRWEYENTKEGDIQDTLDSKGIQSYQFMIHAIGEQNT